MLADVVLPSRRFQVFTYHIPNPLQDKIFVGSPVLIPLGSSVLSGLVVRIFDHSALPAVRLSHPSMAFRDILSVDAAPDHSPLDQRLLTLVEHIADYYLAPLSACLRLIVPPRVFHVVKRLVLTKSGLEAVADSSVPRGEQEVLQKLSRNSNGVLRSSLLRILPKAGTLVTKLKRKGWIEERTSVPARVSPKVQGNTIPRPTSARVSPYGAMDDLFEQGITPSSIPLSNPILHSGTRTPIVDELVDESLSGKFQKRLVIGTDQERLQIFQQIALTLFQQGRRVLFLVPEVHQVEAVARQLRETLSESVEVYHGHLSTPARADCWQRIRQGEAQLVVGTRSALFVPLPNLGLIWVDQEEDASYKDEHLPYYHAREVAGMRGSIEQALVVYGSSCPSLETYSAFRDKIQESVQLFSSKKPVMNLIDMREQASGAILSGPLAERLTQVLNEGQQAVIILNRKGFSQSLLCRDCGQAPTCEACGVSLKLFQRPSRLKCSYCGKSYPTPDACASCQGTVFRFSGVGTQRLEEELAALFPSHPLFRFDRDQVSTAEEGLTVMRKFRQGDIHILIGTEFLLHQPNPPSAKLIGFPQADLGMHLPDFRSAERTFLLFSKAVRLATGKCSTEPSCGEVFLQTRMPDHHVFQAIVQHDPHVFYRQELDLREALAYPPAAHLLLLVVTGAKPLLVQRVVEFLEQQLKEADLNGDFLQEGTGMLGVPMVLGPLRSRKPGRLKKNRTIFLIKTFHVEETQRRLRKIQQAYDQQFRREPVVYELHVDPLEIQ
ncbi:MAG: primosomal protein N' [Nitrospirales bacterium]